MSFIDQRFLVGWFRRIDRTLLCLLLLSFGLRVVLARQGGQGYFPDEGRITVSMNAIRALQEGKRRVFQQLIFSTADHLGYKVAMLGPVWAAAKWHWGLPVLAVLSSGLFSTGIVLWIYALARRVGAGLEEARWATFFAATSCSLFYWSRHLLPYDLALFFGLACLYVSLHPAPRWYHSLLAGVLGFCAFVTYNGYWSFVAFALMVHVIRAWPWTRNWGQFLLRTCGATVGLAGPFFGLLYWAASKEYYLLSSYLEFSKSINQGDITDGHRVIVDYLWAAEGGLLLIWLACMGAFFFVRWQGGVPTESRSRAWLWLSGTVALSLGLIIFSNFSENFVVYGRLVRQLVPFFCLLSGWTLGYVCRHMHWRPKWFRAAAAVIIVAIAAGNFWAPLRQRFDFRRRAEEMRNAYRAQHKISLDRFLIIYPDFIWPAPQPYDLPPHEELLSAPHPLHFRPLLYEGFTRKQREIILTTDIRSRLLLLKH